MLSQSGSERDREERQIKYLMSVSNDFSVSHLVGLGI